MKIAVLVSGGVDSSVALHKLKKQGHDIEAFYLKIWLEDEMSFLGDCPWDEDLLYAEKVCKQVGVPLHVVPLQKEYYKRVVTHTIDAVKNGLTPNPDMLCNREVKFGAFYEKYGKEYDQIATGHYAHTSIDEDSVAHLLRAPDLIKDQTYFLAMMEQEQVKKALFPLGEMQKSEVRGYAEKHGLATAKRKDSQGICFLGKISFTDFIKEHLGVQKGTFIEKETGKELGEHEGFYFYTIGQRRGIDLPGGPWYVCEKDVEKNTVYLTHGFAGKDQRKDQFDVGGINWIAGTPEKTDLHVKLRHGPHHYQCNIDFKSENEVHVQLDQKDQGVTPGQYAVFYDGEECLGGGVII